jgi:hypothetical protein
LTAQKYNIQFKPYNIAHKERKYKTIPNYQKIFSSLLPENQRVIKPDKKGPKNKA